MNNKYIHLSLCVCFINFSHLKAQTEICPFKGSGNITNGINAELIRTDSGNLLGIRVSWSWLSSEPTHCFQSPKVELSTNTERVRRILNSISRNNSVKFYNLDCNVMYTPRVRATFGGQVELFENGKSLFFGGSSTSPPSVLLRVCVGPSTSKGDQTQNRFIISWDPLLCHLQNGADITGYIIQYTLLSTGRTTVISNSHEDLLCDQECGSPYSCRVFNSLFNSNQAYTFQVAAQNNEGIGSFSDPITKSIPIHISQDDITICVTHDPFVPGGTDSTPYSTTSVPPNVATATVTSIESESIPVTASQGTGSVIITTAATYCSSCTCQQVWSLLGSLVSVIAVTAGIVIVVQFTINFALWKRLRSFKKDQALILLQTSTLCEKIDTKECLAYGQVISPQTVVEQPHIYESTT